MGYDFVPVGGIHDRGVDGLEHTSSPNGRTRDVYQCSIEKDVGAKAKRTLVALRDNGVKLDKLVMVSSHVVPNQDTLADELWDEFKVNTQVRDKLWFTANISHSPATNHAYLTHVASHLNEYRKPGMAYKIVDQVSDPRLLIFLRQQVEQRTNSSELQDTLLDTLIVYVLQETDPDQDSFLSLIEIKKRIAELVQFGIEKIDGAVEARLERLSQKPRRVQFNAQGNGYCLPYDVRLQIQERNLNDAALHAAFVSGCEARLSKNLKDSGIRVQDCSALIVKTVSQLFHQQGVEFADFVLAGQNTKAFEKNLPELVARVVEQSSVIPKNRSAAQQALLMTIRDLVYRGNGEEKEFLRRLSQTYMMLFLLQCDPAVATHFATLASKMRVFVCTSILVPALSEFLLEPQNRRHWNLLRAARDRGVKLIINKTILRELASHFRSVKNKYEAEYKATEEIYLADEANALYVDEILLRAYFYARCRQQTKTFTDFLDTFVSSSLSSLDSDLVEFLKEHFGVEYVENDEAFGATVRAEDVSALSTRLTEHKSHAEKARNDASIILTVYAIREKNNELGASGVFGYQTWWLSKDRTTWKVTSELFGDRYPVSCYIRPDFLYNYVALAPSPAQVDDTYEQLFPSLVGVNISFQLPAEVSTHVHRMIGEFHTKSPGRVKAMMRELTDRLKYDPTIRDKKQMLDFFEEQKQRLRAEDGR